MVLFPRQVYVNCFLPLAVARRVGNGVGYLARQILTHRSLTYSIVDHAVYQEDARCQRSYHVICSIVRDRHLRQDRPLIIMRHRCSIRVHVVTQSRGTINDVESMAGGPLFLRFLRNESGRFLFFHARRAAISNVEVRERRHGAQDASTRVLLRTVVGSRRLFLGRFLHGHDHGLSSESVHHR